MVVLSVVLSGAVAFAVARYTVEHDDRIQNEERLSRVYLPLSSKFAGLIACVAPTNACSQDEILQADRAAKTAAVAATALESDRVGELAVKLQDNLDLLIHHRLFDKRPSTALARRAIKQFVALQTQIEEELGP